MDRHSNEQIIAQARNLLQQQQPGPARQLLAPLLEQPAATPELAALCGHAAMGCGDGALAIRAFERWSQLEPGNPEARLRLAAVLADEGQATRAEPLARDIARRHPGSSTAHFVLARALLEQGRYEEAEQSFRTVVRLKPDHRLAHNNLQEVVWMRSGDATRANQAMTQALATHPQLLFLHAAKARLHSSQLQWPEAMAEIRQGLARSPDDPELLAAAVQVALHLDGVQALEHAERLHQLLPANRAVRALLGNACLAAGQTQRALPIAQALHDEQPEDGEALAMLLDARRLLGDPGCRELLDYTRLVRAEIIDCPPGWTDLDTYLAELRRDLLQLHVLQAHPITNSLRGGSQTQLVPERSPHASIRAFPQAIDGAIKRYIAALGHGDDPMRRRVGDGHRIQGMWSVCLRSDGFHLSHYHPAGWISSAFYLSLPPAAAMREGGGWLKFGEPAFATRPALEAEYFIKPEPGLLVLFPSWLWHGTVPFTAPDARRLTIAFDLLPTSAEHSDS